MSTFFQDDTRRRRISIPYSLFPISYSLNNALLLRGRNENACDFNAVIVNAGDVNAVIVNAGGFNRPELKRSRTGLPKQETS